MSGLLDFSSSLFDTSSGVQETEPISTRTDSPGTPANSGGILGLFTTALNAGATVTGDYLNARANAAAAKVTQPAVPATTSATNSTVKAPAIGGFSQNQLLIGGGVAVGVLVLVLLLNRRS